MLNRLLFNFIKSCSNYQSLSLGLGLGLEVLNPGLGLGLYLSPNV